MTMKDLFKARLRIRLLEEEVENPMNVHRWRALEVRHEAGLTIMYSVYINTLVRLVIVS